MLPNLQFSEFLRLHIPQLPKSPKKTSGVPGAGYQWCQPQISKFLRFIISTTRIAAKIVTELCTQRATHSYTKVVTRNDQSKHRGLAAKQYDSKQGDVSLPIHNMHVFWGCLTYPYIYFGSYIHGCLWYIVGVNQILKIPYTWIVWGKPTKTKGHFKTFHHHLPPKIFPPTRIEVPSVRYVGFAHLHVFGTKLWEQTHLRHPQPLKDHVAQRPLQKQKTKGDEAISTARRQNVATQELPNMLESDSLIRNIHIFNLKNIPNKDLWIFPQSGNVKFRGFPI